MLAGRSQWTCAKVAVKTRIGFDPLDIWVNLVRVKRPNAISSEKTFTQSCQTGRSTDPSRTSEISSCCQVRRDLLS